jgi:hypothetical protein
MKRLRLNPVALLAVSLSLILVVQGCEHEPLVPENPVTDEPTIDEECDPDMAYFETEVLPILISNCAKSGCHDAGSAAEDIVLDSYSNVMNADIIEGSDVDDSELYEVITETDPDDVMPPPPNQKLSSEQIATIRDWISQGTKNNTCSLTDCDTTNVTFTNSILPIINNNCKGCHSGPAPSGNLNFATYEGIENAALNGSLLGAVTHAPGFTPMPQGGNKLSDCQIDMIRIWIDEGAVNN